MESQRIKRVFEGHEDSISGLDLTNNSIVSSCDKTVRLWNLDSGTHEVMNSPGSQVDNEDEDEDEDDISILSIAVAADSSIIAAGTSAKLVLIWDTSTRELPMPATYSR